MSDFPRYLIVGGEVFDSVAAAPESIQRRFLTILRELRRSPRESRTLDIVEARETGGDDAYTAAFEETIVIYTIAGPYVLVVDVLWI